MRYLGIGAVALVVGLGCGGDARRGFDDGDGMSNPSANANAPSNGDNGGQPSSGLGATAPPTQGCNESTPMTVASEITIDPAYAGEYHAYDLGQVPGMPRYKYGGIVLADGDDNTLLIGGNANDPGGAVYSVKIRRGSCKHIIGFDGQAKSIASAPHIDGGLVYGPNGSLMFAGWPSNTIGVIPKNASYPARTVEASAWGVPESVAALSFVPKGFPGDGKLKLVAWEVGDWFEGSVSIDGNGVANITDITKIATLPGGPEGFAYIPKGSPKFDLPSMVVSEWSKQSVGAYDVGPSGDPVIGTRRTLLTGLSGAEGAFFDPLTGDFLFSTWNLNRPERLILVTGFAPIRGPK